jgi:hypothetical protein
LNHNKKFFSVSNMGRLFAVILAALICSGAFTVTAHAQASDVYITPDGGGNGICSNNAHPPSWFNNSSNWGSGGTQIGPGTIVHLCGTFTGAINTTMLTAQGSGTSGRPVRILFESGTALNSPVWAGGAGAINISGHSYIVVDGGSNGIIQNTDSGTNLGQHPSSSVGIYAQDCSPGCRVTNLTIANMYIHVAGSDCSVGQEINSAVVARHTDGLRIDHNTFHDMGWAIGVWGNNIEIDHNNIYNIDHGTADGAAANISGYLFHDNHIHDFANWDTAGNCYHHDGIHIWNTDPGTTSNSMIYNNLFDGDSGGNITAYVYTENRISGIMIFNNVFVVQAPRGMAGMIWMGNYFDVAPRIFNNTMINLGIANCTRMESNTNIIFENNITSGCNVFVGYVQGSTISTQDYNLYEAKGSSGGNYSYNILPGTSTDSLATWQSFIHQDSHSHELSARSVNSDGTLHTNSPAINTGANLTSLGISALNGDKNGTARPTSGAWTIGAYNSGTPSSTQPPQAPTNVKATVQ